MTIQLRRALSTSSAAEGLHQLFRERQMEVAFKVAVIVIAVSAMVSTISGLLILYKVKPWKF